MPRIAFVVARSATLPSDRPSVLWTGPH